jgi:ligand-binding SRPBCC domain-containing protein
VSRPLVFEDFVAAPLSEVFRFFSDPRNLPLLMPAELGARLVGEPPPARVGAEVVISIRLAPPLPLRIRWVARITEYEVDHHFTDVQARGPFRRWEHRHAFAAIQCDGREGTLVRDVVAYEVGFGALGRLAHRAFVEARLRRSFEHRQRRLAELMGAAP